MSKTKSKTGRVDPEVTHLYRAWTRGWIVGRHEALRSVYEQFALTHPDVASWIEEHHQGAFLCHVSEVPKMHTDDATRRVDMSELPPRPDGRD